MKPAEVEHFLKEKSPLFAHFSDDQLKKLSMESRISSFEPNEFIIEFGEKGTFLGVMLEGEAEVSVTKNNGERRLLYKVLKGDHFGEASLLTGSNTLADCICRQPCRVVLIPQKLFMSMIAAGPEALSYLSKGLIDHLKGYALDENERDMRLASALASSDDPYGFKLQTDEPMKVLVVNCGSSSLKYEFFDTLNESNNAAGSVERIGLEGTLHKFRTIKGDSKHPLPVGSHQEAFESMVERLTDPQSGVLTSASDISAVGHRGALGGETYHEAEIVTDKILAKMEKYNDLFPLHNPAIIGGIRLAQTLFPHAVHVTVFDNAFHHTIPSFAYLYGLPYELYEEKGLRRFGYHGTSHKYVSLKVAEFLKKPYNKLETIVCHLGNGSSICAIDHGRSVDSSMGFSPLEGLIMGTRCGDVDPGLLLHLIKQEGMGYDELNDLLNRKSGLLGLSGVSSDMREIEAAANEGNRRALRAIKTYAYKVRKYIGSYVAAMDGLDVLAFTGGIGQGSVLVRSLACQGLSRMGIQIDEKKNREADGFSKVFEISAEDSQVKIMVVPTDEERMIARETLAALERAQVTGIIRSHTPMPVTIEVSAHHVHLCDEHVEALFGPGYKLTKFKELSIPSAFACKETVTLVGPKGRLQNVRILGPTRKESQIEISLTEQYTLGIHPPIRESGDLNGTPGITIEGSYGAKTLQQGVICAMRHIHMTPEDALKMGLKDRDLVRVRVSGDRELIFGDVLIRIHPDFKLFMHIDTDEANAANLKNGTVCYVVGIQARR